MHQQGHLGITLLIASCVLFIMGPVYGIIATGLMLQVMMLPDVDQRIKNLRHRGPTHTFAFALGVGIITASAIAYPVELCQETAVQYGLVPSFMIDTVSIWLFIGATVTTSLAGHIAGDIITVGGGYRVRPLWPLSERTVALGLCRSDSDVGNGILLACGCSMMVLALLFELLSLTQILRYII